MKTPKPNGACSAPAQKYDRCAPERGNYQRFYELTVPWLREGAPPPVNPDDAVVVLELIEAARVPRPKARVIDFDPPRWCVGSAHEAPQHLRSRRVPA